MEMRTFLDLLLATDNPLLPNAAALPTAMRLVWAIVLGSGTLLLAGKLERPYRLGLAGLVLVWTALPGSVAPAHWLGLAFQTPSLMSVGICLAWLVGGARPLDPSPSSGPVRAKVSGNEAMSAVCENPAFALNILSLIGVALGWILLLDTLAWLPWSVYAWGFGSAALAAILVLSVLLWAFIGMPNAGSGGLGRFAPVLPFLVLAFFVVTRLPSGNLWDALIDPGLWFALQAWLLVNALRRWKARRLSH